MIWQIPSRAALRPMLRSTERYSGTHESHGSDRGTTNSSAQGGGSYQAPPSLAADDPNHLATAPMGRRPLARGEAHLRHAPSHASLSRSAPAALPMDYEPRVQVLANLVTVPHLCHTEHYQSTIRYHRPTVPCFEQMLVRAPQPPPSVFIQSQPSPAVGAPGVAVMSKARYSQWLMSKFMRDCTSRAYLSSFPSHA